MPAAAVIPAPIAYIKVAAVKKLVVGFLSEAIGPLYECASDSNLASSLASLLCLIAWCVSCDIYFEEIRVLNASKRFEYISMA